MHGKVGTMRTTRLALLAAAAAASVLAPAAAGTSRERALPRSRPSPAASSPDRAFPSRVRFEPNLGQWDARIRWLGRGPSCLVMLADREAIFRLGGPGGMPGTLRGPRAGGLLPAGPGGDLRMEFVGGAEAAPVRPAGRRPSVSHYFLGKDPGRWRSSVPHYDEAAYEGLWPGIDLVFRGDPARLEYDLLVAPGADLSRARLRFTGQTGLALDGEGNLLLTMARGVVRHEAPRLWQETAEGRREVAGAFRILPGGEVGFEAGAHDRSRALVVDPKVDYATFLGGAATDWPMDVVADSAGRIVVAGYTSSSNFPMQAAYQGNVGGGTNDGFVTKYSADGATLLFSTYYGGDGFDDPYGIAVDASDDIIVCGITSSTNLPTVSPFQSTNGGGTDDTYLVKLISTGSYLVFSTYYGGPGQDEAYDVAVDSGGIHLVGATNDAAFPTKSAAQTVYGGGTADALLVKFNAAASSLTYATFFGGAGLEFAQAVAADSSGGACVSGETFSANLPVVGPFQAAPGDSAPSPTTRDAFYMKLAPSGQTVSFASYLGGASDDFCETIAVTGQGEIVLAGHTASAAFPLVQPFQSFYGGGAYDAWCTRVNAQGSGLVFSTYWGGSGQEYNRGMGVDSAGDIVFCGITSSANFPLYSAFQTTYQGGSPINNDGYVVRINGAGNQVRTSTFIGGPGADDPLGMAIDGNRGVIVVGVTDSSSFPVVSPKQSNYGGGNVDAYVLRVALTPPAAPSTLSASLLGGAVQLAWGDLSTNETGFQIERRAGADPFSLLATAGAESQAYQDFAVAPSTSYVYRVRAVNGDGGSAYTNEAPVVTPATIPPPLTPNNLQVAVLSSTRTRLTWNDRSQNEYVFEVQRRIVPGTFLAAASLPAETTEWEDTSVGPDTSLVYRVRAVGVTSPSAWTAEVAAMTPPTFTLSGVKASLGDSILAVKDKAKAKGVYTFGGSPDGAIDPVGQGVTILVGEESNPFVLNIQPGDPLWKVVGAKASWKTPAGSTSKVAVAFDLVKRTFSVKVSNITFPAPVANPVRLSLRVGNDAGSLRAAWVNRKPGVYSYKQP